MASAWQRRFTSLEHEARVVLRTEMASEVRTVAASSAEMVRSVVDERCNELRHAMIGQRCTPASSVHAARAAYARHGG